MTIDDFAMGKKITTPRGTFTVAFITEDEAKEFGYGYHHSSEDGKYKIYANGTCAFAVPVREKETVK